jgi:hypothetical protein
VILPMFLLTFNITVLRNTAGAFLQNKRFCLRCLTCWTNNNTAVCVWSRGWRSRFKVLRCGPKPGSQSLRYDGKL